MSKTNVLILGANGQIAQHAIRMLLEDKNIQVTLFLHKARKLKKEETSQAHVIEGDVLDSKKLKEAMRGQHIVYANLAGELDKQAKSIVEAMKATGLKRLIFISSLGIYNEIPGAFGEWNKREIGDMTISPYRKAADIIEASDLDYTIIRPAWLTANDEVEYETTKKGTPFKGTEVSRKSVAALIVKLIEHPSSEVGSNLEVNKPNTEGDKPAFY
jgi:uncharacterized protein YbjT (DUF2867 family)